MQKVTQAQLVSRARQLLDDGTVSRVLGWRRGDFSYDVTPAVFSDTGALERDFVFDVFCCANLSKYLIREANNDSKGKTLIFLKPCDSYAFNALLTEHRFDREKVYAIGIPCGGMMDVHTTNALSPDGITGAECEGDTLVLHTLYDGDRPYPLSDVLPERCRTCGHGHAADCDEWMACEKTEPDEHPARYSAVDTLEAMTEEERFAFWQEAFSRCIRCNACRDVCPVCTCEKCVFDNPKSGLENKAAADPFEEQMFHIIRAYHVTGRCVDCGECSRVCPQRIPLHLLNRKMILDINRSWGAYTAGAEVGQRFPLVDYRTDDPEASVRADGRDDK